MAADHEPLTPADEDHPQRGIVPTKIPRVPLYSFSITLRLADLPRWEPRNAGTPSRPEST